RSSVGYGVHYLNYLAPGHLPCPHGADLRKPVSLQNSLDLDMRAPLGRVLGQIFPGKGLEGICTATQLSRVSRILTMPDVPQHVDPFTPCFLQTHLGIATKGEPPALAIGLSVIAHAPGLGLIGCQPEFQPRNTPFPYVSDDKALAANRFGCGDRLDREGLP